MNYVTIATGQKIYLDEPDFYGVTIETIAQTLSKICRYNGACKGFYSVARHSRLAALLAHRTYKNTDIARAVLMHDAHEIITSDIVAPVCSKMGILLHFIKTELDDAIMREFNVNFRAYRKEIKEIDHAMLYYEWSLLMPGAPDSNDIRNTKIGIPMDILKAVDVDLKYDPERDTKQFLELWQAYGG